MKQNTTIKEYLTQKNINFKETDKELLTKCLFNGCDDDSKENEAHLYFSIETGQYHCKKCGEKGNIETLANFFGDKANNKSTINKECNAVRLKASIVEECHQALPINIKNYLNSRGITDELIEEHKLGWGYFYGKWWITIPITDRDGKYIFLKLRKNPDDKSDSEKYKVYPSGNEASIFGWPNLNGRDKTKIVVCEGEFDCLILSKLAIPAITSTAGAGTFKKEWLEYLKDFDDVYVAFDKDETGQRESNKLTKLFAESLPETSIYKTTLPDRMTNGKDISDYFNSYNGNPDEFMFDLSKWIAGAEPIDVSKFEPMNLNKLAEILELTIKKDRENKIVTFLCQLSAYTDSAQFNVSFNAPSSTGKSYIPTEIARLFPEKDILELAQCSPTAFFHDFGEWDSKRKISIVDLSRRIIIFLDQPHNDLLARLRPVLSHDKKEIMNKITDKNQKAGLRTKTILIKGFPAVIFCTAGLKIDEQEGTRFILLSPETSQEKLREGISERIKKEIDSEAYQQWLESNPERKLLKERIKAIARAKIKDVKIADRSELEKIFLKERKMLKPRYQRDIGRLINIIKTIALLNLWFREFQNGVLHATESDIQEGVKLWQKIAESQEFNLPPFVYNLFQEIILSLWNSREDNLGGVKLGLTRQEIIKKHYETYKRPLPDWSLRQQILPMLESAGLISQEKDPCDARKFLIYPTPPLTISENNSEKDGGVNNKIYD